MEIKKHSDILKSDWDILIILDACRYDKFYEINRGKFLNSNIYKANSEAQSTIKWLKKHFENNNDYRDVIYISGNPFINSYGYKFPSHLKFYDVYDSWKYRDSIRTEPVDVFYDAKNILFLTRNRVIIHFLQPHYPYEFDKEKLNPLDILLHLIPAKYIKKIKHTLRPFRKKNEIANTIMCSHIENTYKTVYTKKEIVKAYENNIKSVLPFIKKLVKEEVNKKIVITADHSEYLGEDGKYGHGGVLNEFISTVPYVEIQT